MRLLLDTHVFLWSFLAPKRISNHARPQLEDPENELLFSAAGSWEIAVKAALRKLELPEPPGLFVPSRLAQCGITPLPIEHAHALRVADLPAYHRDPFDRLLIAQAQLEDLTIATGDPRFLPYDVDVLWASSGAPPSALHARPKRRWGRRRPSSRTPATRRVTRRAR